MKPGYLYVLVHPSDPNLYKIGVTILRPEERLAQHNRNYQEYVGQIVKNTGQKWELKTYIPVADPYWAEKSFWGATHFSVIPFRGGIEVEKMEWELVLRGLDAARKAGIRPKQNQLPDHVYAYTASIRKRLEGREITLLGYVRSLCSGKANFQCINGHVWRTTPARVGDGDGCPECGTGKRDPKEIRQQIGAGVICLLTHPDKPGFVKIGVAYDTLEDVCKEYPWDEWEIHRFRNVDEITLAESIIWKLLGEQPFNRGEPIEKNLSEAEDVFRKLIYVMREVIALEEMQKEVIN
jgi:hypothetical protein